MARKQQIFLLVITLLLSEKKSFGQLEPLEPKINSGKKIQAFKQYWESFDAYENQIIGQGKTKYQESWITIKELKAQKEHEYTLKQIELLEESVYEYKLHLKNHSRNSTAAFVMLNLAQILNKIGDLRSSLQESGIESKQEALAILSELSKEHPEFTKREAAIYLKAIILSTLKADKKSLETWRSLAKIAQKSLYGVHAHIAIGDHYFKTEKANRALKEYKLAENLLKKIELSKKDFEMLRIQYRKIWASYRSANLKTTISTGIKILQPDRVGHLKDMQMKIKEDAIQLIGDALFEMNDLFFTKATIKRNILKEYAGKITLRTLRNYAINKVYNDLIELGEYTLRIYPANNAAPEILAVLADAYKQKKNITKRIHSLEKLSLFLPEQSLWRSRFKDDYTAIKKMEKLALAAAYTASNWYYQKGMQSGNPSNFQAAASYFNVLLKYERPGSKTNTIRLKLAHCQYFAERYEKAASIYQNLIMKHDIDHATLKIAAFQLVLSKEKMWRHTFTKKQNKGVKPQSDGKTLKKLEELETAVEKFSTRFPARKLAAQSEVVNDALLIAASANRDHERFAQAIKYWQRVLISNPATGQRAIAIRGIVMARVFAGKPEYIIEATKNFLRLEQWDKLGLSLDRELRGILSQATQELAQNLEKDGDFAKAGKLLVGISSEFKKIPNRPRLFRDGAYMLAMGGKWQLAEKAALAFQNEKIRKNAGDISYLVGKAQDYQMRFPEAAKSYFRHGKMYPKHRKSRISLERSQEIATADSNFKLAGRSAELSGDREQRRSERIKKYRQAYHLYRQGGDLQSTLATAKKNLTSSKTLEEKLMAELDIAKAEMDTRDEDTALERFAKIASISSRNKSKINRLVFQKSYGESQFYLATESIDQLHDFNVLERGGNLKKTVAQKMRYFEKAVKHLELAIKSSHPEWESRCRYLLGAESEKLAEDLNKIILEANASDSYRQELKLKIQQLKKIAKVQFSSNVLAQSRKPTRYKNNSWIKKSRLKVSYYSPAIKDSPVLYVAPASLSLNIPQQWSTQ